MLYLVLAILCSVTIGVLFKYTGQQGIDRVALLTINYVAAVGVGVVLFATGGSVVEGDLSLSAGMLGLSAFVGVLLIAGFFLLSLATDLAGMSLALGVWRVSVVLPFLASWVIWAEPPSGWQGAGMALAAIAFFLIAQQSPSNAAREEETASVPPTASAEADSDAVSTAPAPVQTVAEEAPTVASFGVLLLLFLSSGAIDISLKTFSETYNAAQGEQAFFLLLSFGMAGLVGLVPVLTKGLRHREWPTAAAYGWGTVLGIVNYGSLEVLLRALGVFPGTVVFPVNHLAIVLLGAVVGVFIFGEYLSRINRWGIALATVALVLLMM
jgi:multidrug transporter EmrE-like cation transporter